MFGSRAYVHIPKTKREGKFERKADVGYLVGFERDNSYRVYIPAKDKVFVSRDVTIDEAWIASPDEHISFEPNEIEYNDPFEAFKPPNGPLPTTNEDVTNTHTGDDSDAANVPPLADESDDEWQDAVTYHPDVRRSTRQSKPPERFGFESALFVQETLLQNEAPSTPLTYREAINAADSSAWKCAMDDEIQQINKKGTWTLVDFPPGYKPVKCKWVYAAKMNADNRITRHRARLVAKGFNQKKGINYDEVFSPVVKYSTIRLILAIAAHRKLNLTLLDVKTAFLNGDWTKLSTWSNQKAMSLEARGVSYIVC